jgi:hypothetical protein
VTQTEAVFKPSHAHNEADIGTQAVQPGKKRLTMELKTANDSVNTDVLSNASVLESVSGKAGPLASDNSGSEDDD